MTLFVISLSVLACIHFLFYKACLNGSLFLHSYEYLKPCTSLSSHPTCPVKHSPNCPFCDTLTGLWTYYTTALIQATINSASSLNSHIGNSASHYQFLVLFSILTIWNLWLFFLTLPGSQYTTSPLTSQRKQKFEKASPLPSCHQACELTCDHSSPVSLPSCSPGRGFLLLRGLFFLPGLWFFLLQNLTSLVMQPIFSFVNVFYPCFFRWGLRWPQASSLKTKLQIQTANPPNLTCSNSPAPPPSLSSPSSPDTWEEQPPWLPWSLPFPLFPPPATWLPSDYSCSWRDCRTKQSTRTQGRAWQSMDMPRPRLV